MNTTTPVTDKTLWDDLGNYCRVTLHFLGSGSFEVYFHNFNNATPVRYINTIGICNNLIDNWLANKKAAGFAEPLPPQNHPPIN